MEVTTIFIRIVEDEILSRLFIFFDLLSRKIKFIDFNHEFNEEYPSLASYLSGIRTGS
jgi:hypothetical protein